MTRTHFVTMRNFAFCALLIGVYFSTSSRVFPQGCTAPAPPTDGPCGLQDAQCESAALNSCLSRGGTCATCNVSATYAACGSTYSQCIWDEKQNCKK